MYAVFSRSTSTAPTAPRSTKAALSTVAAFLLPLSITVGTTGCSTKNYVRNQTTPVVNQTNELDDKTSANNRALQELDKRTGNGIQGAQTSAQNAQQSASAAGSASGTAQQGAQDAVHRATTLGSVVANLDTYKQVDNISVTFGFNKADLTKQDQAQLDGLGAQLGAQRSYILSLTGGTDSVGSAAYNYELSDKRADAVVQYLAARYGVPAHRFYLIGLGKDQEVASNSTASGRAQNRRVQIQLLTNQPMQPADGSNASSGAGGATTGAVQPQ